MSTNNMRPDIMERKAEYLRARRTSHTSSERTHSGPQNTLERTAPISRAFRAAHENTSRNVPAGNGSDMVRREKPYPAPRPSPDIAAPVDAASHMAALERERRRAGYMQQRIIETNCNPERRNR